MTSGLVSRRAVLGGATVASVGVVLGAGAPAASEPDGVQTDLWGVALGGHDATSYFEPGDPVRGTMRFELQWNGATWRFGSAEAMARFLADPDRFTPAFGGRCAWSAGRGVAMRGDPSHYLIEDGRLLLFAGPTERDAYLAGAALGE